MVHPSHHLRLWNSVIEHGFRPKHGRRLWCTLVSCFVIVPLRAASDKASFFSLLGLFEAGMLPGIAYYLSRWYRRKELAFRLSLYIVAAPLAGAFGGLLASAILTLEHFGSLQSWRMIFGIEGTISEYSLRYNIL